MNETKEFNQGQKHREMCYSIHYNPYRHKGTPDQFCDWIKGWMNKNGKS